MKSLLKIAAVVMLSIILQTCKKLTLPVLKTENVSEITQISATSGGEVTNNGGNEVSARGLCWDINQKPTISSSKTTDGSGNGPFTSKIAGLSANTTYYARAYATNNEGIGYGNEISFKTNQVPLATLTTTAISAITSTTAVSGGNITDGGGSDITARGVCWNASPNPTTENYFTTEGPGPGSFTSNLTNLQPATTYYVRAYATNSGGTVYANELSFITLCTEPAPAVGTITQPTCALATGSVILSGLPATGTWTITRTPGGTITTGTGTSTSITGLVAGTYTFTVTNNSGCVSVASGDVVINAQPTTPGIPAVGKITEPNCMLTTGSVALSGLPSTGTWTLITNPGAIRTTGTGTNTIIQGLTMGPVYTFSVINSEGCGSPVSIPVTIFIPLPSALTSPQTISFPPVSVTLNGSVNGNGSSTVVTFEYGTSTSYGNEITATESPVTGNSSVSAVLPNIFLLTEYHFRVKAVNCAGTTYGDDLVFSTPGPFGF